MAALLARRFLISVVVIFAVTTATFFIIRLAPGDPFTTMDRTSLPVEIIESTRAHYGLDQPLLVQYGKTLTNLIRLDFGTSLRYQRPVSEVLAGAVEHTLLLGTMTLVMMFVLGLTVGAVQAWYHRQWPDRLLTIFTLGALSIPIFWLGLMLLELFSLKLGWLPTIGPGDITLQNFFSKLDNFVLPVATLSLVGAAHVARYQRGAFLDIAHQPFVRTAYAKGLTTWRVRWVHELRNALLTTIVVFGTSLPIVLSGAALVEFVFSWNGLGRLMVEAVSARDYPVADALSLLTAVAVVTGNFIADGLTYALDPRTRTAL